MDDSEFPGYAWGVNPRRRPCLWRNVVESWPTTLCGLIVWVSAGEAVGFLAPTLAFVISTRFTIPALPRVAWLVGLAVFFAVASPLWRAGQSMALVVAIGVLAGVLMAVGMAAVTGGLMRMLLRTRLPVAAG